VARRKGGGNNSGGGIPCFMGWLSKILAGPLGGKNGFVNVFPAGAGWTGPPGLGAGGKADGDGLGPIGPGGPKKKKKKKKTLACAGRPHPCLLF